MFEVPWELPSGVGCMQPGLYFFGIVSYNLTVVKKGFYVEFFLGGLIHSGRMKIVIPLLFSLLVGCSQPMDSTNPVIRNVTIVVGQLEVIETDPATPMVQIPTVTDEPKLTFVEQPTYILCSPLADQKLEDLAEIVSSPYDPPPEGKDDRHQGVDFAYYNRGGRNSIEGEEVQAILPGRVAAVMLDRLPYGNSIIVETPQSYLPTDLIADLGMRPGESLYSLYAHFISAPEPGVGEWVNCGASLGQAGSTGYNIPVVHLHLEIRIGPADTGIGTMAFYDTRATEEEMDAYRLWRMSGEFRHFDPMKILNRGYFYLEQQP